MTPDQALEASAVMIAFANGRKIEYRSVVGHPDWTPIKSPTWAWDCSEYRVAPELWQRKIWVHDENPNVIVDKGDGWKPLEKGWRLITVKEVLT